MRLGEAVFSFSEFTIEFLQFAVHAILPEIVKLNEDFDYLRIEGRMNFHLVQKVSKTGVMGVTHIMKCVCNTLADMFY